MDAEEFAADAVGLHQRLARTVAACCGDADRYLNVVTGLNELAPQLAGDGPATVLPDSTDERGPIGVAMVACHFAAQTSLSAGLDGPAPMTVEVDDDARTVRVAVGG